MNQQTRTQFTLIEPKTNEYYIMKSPRDVNKNLQRRLTSFVVIQNEHKHV